MSETWREAWEREKHAVGRAVHEAWAAEKIRQGFADHVFQGENENWPCDVPKCSKPDYRHHPDMLDYDDLAPHIQAYDIETGIVGFRMGFEAAARQGRGQGEDGAP